MEEDPGGPNDHTTNYLYDVLNDLTSVTQGYRTRTFQYDSRGLLTSAAIPEAYGATSYVYDDSSGELHDDIASVIR